MSETDALSKKICELAQEYCIELTVDQADLMVNHLLLVEEKNKYLNLTRIISLEDGVVRHILDSLLFLPSLVRGAESRFKTLSCSNATTNRELVINPSYFSSQRVKNLRLLDIGTGAGFPGIPLAIYSGLDTLLLDSVGKKITAVKEFVDTLGLNTVCTSSMRAEELAKKNTADFDFVVARAVAELRVLIEYASPLLVTNGILVASKGNVSDAERTDANRAAEICGLTLLSQETYELPNDSGHREIFAYIKNCKAKIKLPRAVGAAKHKPL
ncbi:MAG: 16S rRNA (guanine(527)-N(7))-methyltransferase RsmG [Olsenella sp.]|nr:16S rRNA (guanine(527)-N(7))-methyltransferase RsmG [Olsenella sp.]